MGVLAPASLQPEFEGVAHNAFVPQFPYTCQKPRTPMIQALSEIVGPFDISWSKTEPSPVGHLYAKYSKCLKKANIPILFAMQSKSSAEFCPDLTHFYVLITHEK